MNYSGKLKFGEVMRFLEELGFHERDANSSHHIVLVHDRSNVRLVLPHYRRSDIVQPTHVAAIRSSLRNAPFSWAHSKGYDRTLRSYPEIASRLFGETS